VGIFVRTRRVGEKGAEEDERQMKGRRKEKVKGGRSEEEKDIEGRFWERTRIKLMITWFDSQPPISLQ
jgi:hypothetical protein